VINFFVQGALIGLLLLNRSGRRGSRIAAYLFILVLIGASAGGFTPESLTVIGVIFVLPILASSFLIAPPAAFPVAIISGVVYGLQASSVIGFQLDGAPTFYALAFLVVALIAFLAASSGDRAIAAERIAREQLQRVNLSLDAQVNEQTRSWRKRWARARGCRDAQGDPELIADGVGL
jgi:hypothetical protein